MGETNLEFENGGSGVLCGELLVDCFREGKKKGMDMSIEGREGKREGEGERGKKSVCEQIERKVSTQK